MRRMSRRFAVNAILAGAAILVMLCGQAVAQTKRPNIVLIVCDDLGFSDLGCYGGEIATPHLDRLAEQGSRFTQFYNCAVCVTTRAAMYTGLHPRQKERPLLRQDMTTLAEVLSDAGYRTCLTGKWHLGPVAPRRPTDRGFQEYYGVASGCCNYFDPAMPDPVFYNGGQRRPFLHNETPVREFPDDFYTTDAFSDHAISQIEKYASSDAPFFLNICYTAPHFPLHARPEDIEKYKGRYDQGYFHLRQARFQRLKELGLIRPQWKLSQPDHRLGEFRYDYDITPWDEVEEPAREKRRMEVYAAMVDRLDHGIGRVLDALDRTGVADDTLVLFFSDNGGCASFPGYSNARQREGRKTYNQELPGGKNTYAFVGPGWGWAQCAPFRRYKVWTYEGGIATPMIARWPNHIQPGSISREVSHVVDIMPTLAELAGAAYPQTRNGKPVAPMEGHSLVPTFHGKQRAGHDSLCWYLFGNRAVRQGKWKLVWGVTAGVWELYDMEADRTETRDLAQMHPDRVAKMAAAWNEWAERTEVPLDAPVLK